MTVTRRRLLGLFAALPLLSACDWFNRKFKGLKMQPISAEEIELLKKPLIRPAYQASKGLPQGVLVISERVFGDERSLLRSADIKDVRFVNCSFEMMQGYDNNLENVTFEECQFLGGVLTGPQWKNVKFLRCVADGPFEIGCADGDVTFEECTLKGMTKEEGGYGNWSDHFGLATGQDGYATYLKCKMKNLQTGGAKSMRFIECEIGDLYANSRSQRGELLIERCKATGKHMFGGNGNNFSRITIKDSKLGHVDLVGASSDVVEILNSSLSLEMKSRGFREIKLIKTNFHTEGFRCTGSTFLSMTIEGCSFEPTGKGLRLHGIPNPYIEPGKPAIFWGRTRELIFRNISLSNAELACMQIGVLTLDKALVKDTDLSKCCIDTIEFKNARLEGNLDLTETTIRRIENNGLVNQAKIKGKLEANPDAPKPVIDPPKPAELKKPEENADKKEPESAS